MSNQTLIVAAGILLLVLLGGFLLRDQLFPTAEMRRERLLRRLNAQEIVVRRSCSVGEVYVDAARWNNLSGDERVRAASAIASWCAEQGGGGRSTFSTRTLASVSVDGTGRRSNTQNS